MGSARSKNGTIELTARQRDVLSVVVGSIERHGYSPTLREIGAQLGIASTNFVFEHIRALGRKGYLNCERGKSRTLRPTTLGFAMLGRA